MLEGGDGQQQQQSVAVRLALGETQLVAETKQFLIENGIHLDAFQDVNSLYFFFYLCVFYVSVLFIYFNRLSGTKAAIKNCHTGEKFGCAI